MKMPCGTDNHGWQTTSGWPWDLETLSALLALCEMIHGWRVDSSHRGQAMRSLDISFVAWAHGWFVGVLRCRNDHEVFTVMNEKFIVRNTGRLNFPAFLSNYRLCLSNTKRAIQHTLTAHDKYSVALFFRKLAIFWSCSMQDSYFYWIFYISNTSMYIIHLYPWQVFIDCMGPMDRCCWLGLFLINVPTSRAVDN